jgi:hypothetical protein
MTRSDRRPLIGRQVAPPQLVLFDPEQRVLASATKFLVRSSECCGAGRWQGAKPAAEATDGPI